MIRKLLIGLIGLVLLIILLLYFLVATQLGLRIGFDIAKHFIPGKLSIAKLSGKLAGPLSIEDLHYKNATIKIKLNTLKLDWAPIALFSHRIDIKSLDIDALHIKQKSSATEQPGKNNSTPFKLPIQFNLQHIHLTNISYQQDNNAPIIIQKASLSAYSFFHQINIKKLQVTSAPYTLQLNGSTHVTTPYQSKLQGSLTDKALMDKPVTINFDLEGDLNQAELKAGVKKPFTANLTAKLSKPLEHGPINITGNWQHLKWPLSKTDKLKSPTGTLNVTGTLKSYHVNLSTSVTSKQIPNTSIELNAHGNWESLIIDSLKAQLLSGNLLATGKVNWQPNLSWQVKLSGHGLNPAVQWHTHSGSINFNLISTGQMSNTNSTLTADLTQLGGTLNNQPLSGHASIRQTNQTWFIKSLALNAGKNHLSASGSLGEHSNFNWHASLADLSLLLEDDAGDITSQGHLNGKMSNPKVAASLSLNNFNYNNLVAKQIKQIGRAHV